MNRWLAFMTVLTMMLAGCVTEETVTGDEEPSVVETAPTATMFPSWSADDHNNLSHANDEFSNLSYMAYFSAPWCAHCESTIDAYDLVIPEGRIAVFSMEAREEYANMSEWQNRTEVNLNRTLTRPFMLHPELAKSVDVKSIPHAVFVNEQGYVYHVEIGKETNLTYIQSMWDLTSSARFNTTTGWSPSPPEAAA